MPRSAQRGHIEALTFVSAMDPVLRDVFVEEVLRNVPLWIQQRAAQQAAEKAIYPLDSVWAPKVDLFRLGLLWVIVATLTAGIVFVLGGARLRPPDTDVSWLDRGF